MRDRPNGRKNACEFCEKLSGGSGGLAGGVGSATTSPANSCDNEPCMRHGKCVSRQSSYECHCYPRYSGHNCEIEHGRSSRYLEYTVRDGVGRANSYTHTHNLIIKNNTQQSTLNLFINRIPYCIYFQYVNQSLIIIQIRL